MSRRAGITYSVTDERARRGRAHPTRLREGISPKVRVPSLRSGESDEPDPDYRTMPMGAIISPPPDSASSGSDDEEQAAYIRGRKLSRTFRDAVSEPNAGSDQKDPPGHNIASKLRQQGPGALSDVCNKHTISKDNTVGNQAQMDELLANFGKKVFGVHSHELREQPSPHTVRIKALNALQATLRQVSRRHAAIQQEDLLYIQTSRAAMGLYATAKRASETDNDSSHSEEGAESEELSDYEYEKTATGRSRERRQPTAGQY